MRYLKDKKEEELKKVQCHKEIDTELQELGSRLDDLTNVVEQNKNSFIDYTNEPNITKHLGNIDNIHSETINTDTITANTATLDDIKSETLITNNFTAQDIQSATASIQSATIADINNTTITSDEATFTLLKSGSIETDTIKADKGEILELDIKNATIDVFNLNDINAENIDTKAIKATNIDIENIKSDKATLDIIESDASHLRWIQARNITFDGSQNELEPYYIHIEPSDTPSETDYRIIELPYFDTGDYYLSLRHPLVDIAWWSVIVHNNHNNITVSYSRRITDLKGETIPNPTLSEMYVYDYFSNTPRLYLKTFVGGNLYWHNHSLNKETQPILHNEYPIDVSSYGALPYKCINDGATWFTKHIDIIKNEDEGNSSLFIIPGDWATAERKQVEYNGLVTIPWKFYFPNQSLDTSDDVTFRHLNLQKLEGKWLYNKSDSLFGINTKTIDTDGQLNASKNIIETEQLIKWNGKVGTTVDNHTVVNGLIYREQGYNQTAEHIYEKQDVYNYDIVEWNNKEARTDIVSVIRKDDDAIITSEPPIIEQYEDEGQIFWNKYTYTYPDIFYKGTHSFEVWIDRQLDDGTWVNRLLQTTVNQEEYRNFTRHKEEFEYGTIDYNKWSFDDYHNSITYVGDVTEGRWNAGDVHITKKQNPPNSAEPEYNGTLIVDGTTELRDNFSLQKENGDKVDLFEINAKTININGDDLNINITNNKTETVNGNVVETIDTDKTITIGGNKSETITGNVVEEIIADKTETINGNFTENVKTDKTIVIDGSEIKTINTDETITVVGNKTETVNGNFIENIDTDKTVTVGGNITETATNKDVTLTNDNTLNAVNNTVTLTGKDLVNADSREVEVDSEKHTYKSIEFVGHNESETDFNFSILDNVEIGKNDDKHNLLLHGTLTPDDIEFKGNADEAIRLRNDNGKILMKGEPIADVIDGVLQSEDKIVTADVLGLYNGQVSNDTYPITEIGDNSTVHGNINATNNITAQNITSRETIETVDLFTKQNAVIEKDVTIHGNLVVDGKVLATDKESLNTSSDYAILRKDAPNGLGASMKSGVIIHNFDGNGTSGSLAIDKDGTFRISNIATEDTTEYTNISYWADTGVYYEGLSTTVKDVNKGAIVKQDSDDFEAVIYNDEYYHNTETTKWYKLYLDNNTLTFDSTNPITDGALVVILSGLKKSQLIYYRTLSITVIDDANDQPILTRDETAQFYDKAPLMWDANENKAVKIIADPPPKKNLTIVTELDNLGQLSYKWGKAGSGSGAVLVLTQAEYDTRILITDMEDEKYIPNNALVCISDAENEYLSGEE